ncbi:phage tail tape measure protein, partial [bacterium]
QVIVDFLLNTAKFETDIKKATKSFKNMGKELTAAGKTMTAGVTLPLVAAGAAVVKFANDFDEGMDKIRSGTGATGKNLESLGQSMKNVMSGVPQGVTDVSSAITDLNQRLGLTGKPLEEMVSQMLNLSRITGTDVGPLIKSTTELFSKWSIETEKQSGALDYLYKTSQATGVGIQRLTDLSVQFATPLKNVGLGLEDAAVMMAQWEKEGVNVEQAVMGLTKGMSAFAKAGQEPAEALNQLQLSIKGAGSETEAMAIAVKAFGTRAGPELAKAIREGRFSIEELVQRISESGDTINQAAADTMSFSEKMGILGNRVALAAAPLGDALLKAFDKLMPYIEKAINFVTGLVEKFSKLPESTQMTVIALAAVAAAIGPVLLVLGSMATGISTLSPMFVGLSFGITGTVSAFRALAGALTWLGPIGMLTSNVGALITAFGPLPVIIASVGAAFAGWEIGKWLNQFESVRKAGEAVAAVLLKVTGTAPNVGGALGNLEGTTQRLADKLKSLGVNVDRFANETVENWATRVNTAAKAHKELRPQIEQVTKVTDTAGKAIAATAISVDDLGKKTKDLTAEIKDAYAPFNKLTKQIEDEMKIVGNVAPIQKHYAVIMQAATEQIRLGGTLSNAQVKLLEEAYAMDRVRIASDKLDPSLMDLSETSIDLIANLKDLKESTEDAYAAIQNMKPSNPFENPAGMFPELNKFIVEVPGDFEKATGKASESMNDLGRSVSTTLTNMTQDLAEKLTKWAGPFQDFAKAAFSSLMEGLFNPLISKMTEVGNQIGDWLGGIFGKGGGATGSILGGGASTAGGGVASAGGGAASAAGSAASFGTMALASAIGGAVSGIIGLFKDRGDMDEIERNTRETAIDVHGLRGESAYWILGSLLEIQKASSEARDHIKAYLNLLEPIANAIASIGTVAPVPALASGTSYVPNDMLAYLHRGEAVVPASQNRSFSYQGGGININLAINGGSEDIVQTVKNKVIPILKQEMAGGNTGFREAVVRAYGHTVRAY